MFELAKGIQSILEACLSIKRNEKVLVIAYNEGRSMWVGYILMDVVNSMGGEATLTIMAQREIAGHEPPPSVAAAMKNVDTVIQVCDKASIAHTNARKEASAAGVRYAHFFEIPADDLKPGVSTADILLTKERTDRLSAAMTKANVARLTTPSGTDLTMNLADREGITISPLGPDLFTLPYYAETAIAPVEGSAEGVVVVDLAMRGWSYLLREPLRYSVKAGKVVEVFGSSEDAERFRKICDADEHAANLGELGIGTSHIIPKAMMGNNRDFGRMGTAHIGIGRNNDIGGETWSRIHLDGLMSRATLELDNKCVLREGTFLI